VVLGPDLLALLLRFRAAHALSVLVALLLGHELAAIDPFLILAIMVTIIFLWCISPPQICLR
jgi:hypothetical protein